MRFVHDWWAVNWLVDYRELMLRRFMSVPTDRMFVGSETSRPGDLTLEMLESGEYRIA